MKEIIVNAAKPYAVVIGRNILKEQLSISFTEKYDHIGLVVNETVYSLYKVLIDDIVSSDQRINLYIMEDGESHKKYSNGEVYLNKLLEDGFSRSSMVVAIGGGVTGDFTGYLAALYMRGIDYIQVPTTHLAMVDSSIGGKVAVNISMGKNIVGAFYPPKRVIVDLEFLKTLKDDEFRCGLAETIKHAILGVPELIDILEENDFQGIKSEGVIDKIIELSASFKIKVVSDDEKEKGLRTILNFGHTIGHAIESWCNYKGPSHGEAVAMGMKMAMEISFSMDLLSEDDYQRACKIVDKFNLGELKIDLDTKAVIADMKYDKKNKNNKVKFVLLTGISNPVYDKEVSTELLERVISNY